MPASFLGEPNPRYAPPPSIPTDGMSFCLSQIFSIRSGIYFRNDNYLRVQGERDLTVRSLPSHSLSQHSQIHFIVHRTVSRPPTIPTLTGMRLPS